MARRAGGEVISLEKAREASGSESPATSAEPMLGLRDYLGIVLKRRWVIIAFLAIVVAGASVFVYREPNIYRATASLEIAVSAPRYLGNGVQDVADTSGGMYWQTKEFFETQYQIIRSRVVAQRVVDKLGLASDPDFLGLAGMKDPQKQRDAMARSDAVGRLKGLVRVEPIKDSRIVNLSIEETNPERAARLANALAEAYIEQNLERRLDTTKAASLWLSDQLSGLKQKLESSELKLYDFKREKDILTTSFEDRQSISSQRLVALNETLTRVKTRLAELDAKKRTVDDARRRFAQGDGDALEAIPGVALSVAASSLRGQLVQLLQEKAVVEARYLDKHPKRAEVDARIAEVRSALTKEIDKALRMNDAEYRETVDTEKNLAALINGARREAFEVNKHSVDYNRLKREQENNQRLYDLVLSRLKETDLSGRLSTNNVQMLDRALVPKAPVKPDRFIVVLVAICVGLIGGIGLAVLFEHLDDTLKSPDEVERLLGVPFLGIVPSINEAQEEGATPAERGRNRDLQTHRRPKSSAAECIRAVRTNLLFTLPDKQLKRLLVTSSSPQEGKTTVATNLAIAMAQSGARTLLVDTDMRRPRLHRAFGLPNDGGISSVIVGQAKLDDVVRETVVPNLFLLPCGPIPPNPSELIHTARFKQLLIELDSKFDRVIFDSPPVAAVSDALVLSDDVDGVVLVVKSNQTSREVVLRTRNALVDVKARMFGVVLNNIDLTRRGYGYYYYYQRYGYYYGEKPGEANG